jgi:hypothetical protein
MNAFGGMACEQGWGIFLGGGGATTRVARTWMSIGGNFGAGKVSPGYLFTQKESVVRQNQCFSLCFVTFLRPKK